MASTDEKMTIRVRAIPNARQNSLEPLEGGGFKVRVQAPPDRGAANRAIIQLLAKHWSVRKRDICLVVGEHSRDKVFQINRIG